MAGGLPQRIVPSEVQPCLSPFRRASTKRRNLHEPRNHASAQTESQHQRPPTVYLVDDDISFLRALSRLLRAADYRVETFALTKEFLKCDRFRSCRLRGARPADTGNRRSGVAGGAQPIGGTLAGDLCYSPSRHFLLGARN